ncbi:MAG: GNAT family N-acetyltransferase [Kordiimonadaceae bacterium]|nr:GNAT family N-acetyltransferase [Kordiimonadaceae bacterium]MBO6569936.1 GNAT family N-acetyltransferase [Kordiimonadaceae bacterium]MBO6965967.1 GNAT family N-acetyltransferase [Kordiimonadaceae bacterium]
MKSETRHTRPVLDTDAEALFQLIEHCYADYEGVVVERDGIDADLNRYASVLTGIGGQGLVVENAGKLMALVSGAPIAENKYQLKKLYLHNSLRGSGIATELVAEVVSWARNHGASTLELWSDTRFERAHRFYEREGFVRQKSTRELHDLSNSVEFQFVKQLQSNETT